MCRHDCLYNPVIPRTETDISHLTTTTAATTTTQTTATPTTTTPTTATPTTSTTNTRDGMRETPGMHASSTTIAAAGIK